MSMLGVTRGAVNVGASLCRLRREVHLSVVDTVSTPDVQIITPLEEILSKHRVIKALVLFCRRVEGTSVTSGVEGT